MHRAPGIACLALFLLAGCAGDRTSGAVRESVRIPSGDPIGVVWNTGLFAEPYIHNQMMLDGTYGKAYENCVNAWIEGTFRMNGHLAKARRVTLGEQPVAPAGTRYVLVIVNKGATMPRRREGIGAMEGFGTVFLEMDVELRDRARRKVLWTGSETFFTDARRNAAPVLRIVRGLAADGYLERGAEQVVDYAGRPKLPEDLPACPG